MTSRWVVGFLGSVRVSGFRLCCECWRSLASNFGRCLSLGSADDQRAPGGFDDVFGDCVEVVDTRDSVDLYEQTVSESRVAAGDPRDGGDGLMVGEVVGVEGFPRRFQ